MKHSANYKRYMAILLCIMLHDVKIPIITHTTIDAPMIKNLSSLFIFQVPP